MPTALPLLTRARPCSRLPLNAAPDADRTISLLGTGTFGKVILCRDERSEREVAIKVVRAIYKYR